ncbi:MAG: hypothetical protein O7C60_01715 [Rickettsia endosymbiont of Ixodes persulcatus]|nr:hypothetical protein [Rickettsia endosymbiont of Ixodes persulcatus]
MPSTKTFQAKSAFIITIPEIYSITALSAKAQGFDIVVLLPSDHHIVDDIN